MRKLQSKMPTYFVTTPPNSFILVSQSALIFSNRLIWSLRSRIRCSPRPAFWICVTLRLTCLMTSRRHFSASFRSVQSLVRYGRRFRTTTFSSSICEARHRANVVIAFSAFRAMFEVDKFVKFEGNKNQIKVDNNVLHTPNTTQLPASTFHSASHRSVLCACSH